MPKMIEKQCKTCKNKMQVRLADHNRGWGNFCSKSCKAKKQEQRTGQHSAYLNGRGVSNLHPERLKEYDVYRLETHFYDDMHPFSSEALGQWDD